MHEATAKGTEYIRWGIDYFAFRGDMFTHLPPFAVGRAAYDNYLVQLALSRGVPVIDGSGELSFSVDHHVSHHIPATISAAHQPHSYAHVKGGNAVETKGNDVPESEADRVARRASSSAVGNTATASQVEFY